MTTPLTGRPSPDQPSAAEFAVPDNAGGKDSVSQHPATDSAVRSEQHQDTRHSAKVKRAPMSAGHAVIVVLTALLTGTIFNAETIEKTADAQKIGLQRDIALFFIRPLARTSKTFGLHIPREKLEELFGQDDDLTSSLQDSSQGAQNKTPEPHTPENTSEEEPKEKPIPSWALSNIIWVGGDSTMIDPAPALARLLDNNPDTEWTIFAQAATGIVRSDYFDWQKKMEQEMESHNPRVVVIAIGANDGQAIPDQTLANPQRGHLSFASNEWKAEYAARVGKLMDFLSSEGRPVLWVGQPVMRDKKLNEKTRLINKISKAEAKQRLHVTFVSTQALFTDKNGHYSTYLNDKQGAKRQMRMADGIHLTQAGAEFLARHLLPLTLDKFHSAPTPRTSETSPPIPAAR